MTKWQSHIKMIKKCQLLTNFYYFINLSSLVYCWNKFYTNKCIKMLKVKNCEGHDRISQRVLIDGMDLLIDPLTKLFPMVYRDCTIPGQWLVAKITPIQLLNWTELNWTECIRFTKVLITVKMHLKCGEFLELFN